MKLRLWGLVLLSVVMVARPGAAACRREIEPNQTASQATEVGVVTDGGCRSGSLAPAGDVDVYGFAVERATDVTIEVDTAGDTRLDLYDETGRWLAGDQGVDAGRSTRIALRLEKGRYAVVVESDGEVESYVIRWGRGGAVEPSSCPIEKEANGNFGLADALEPRRGVSCRSGSIDPRHDVDFYSFRLDADATVRVWTVSEGDTMLWLYDTFGTILDSDDDAGAGEASALTRVLRAGRYYAVVTSFENRSVIGSYEVHLQVDEHAAPDEDARAASGTEPPPWGWTITGDGVLFSAWGEIDGDCADGAGQDDSPCRTIYEVAIPADGYVALALIDEVGQQVGAMATNALGTVTALREPTAPSIYSDWSPAQAGTVRIEIVFERPLVRSAFELHVLFSVTPADPSDLVLRYGPETSTL